MTAPIVYVVDASAAAQVISPEPLTAKATDLFALLVGGQAAFHVPDLFYIACANIFWKKKQRGVCSESQAIQALSDLLALPLTTTAHAVLFVIHSFRDEQCRTADAEAVKPKVANYAQRADAVLQTATEIDTTGFVEIANGDGDVA
jgi:predicted nucleic acid-binding protein